MSITLRELLQIPQIANEVIAGEGGLDNSVVWAHACEMPEPWDWLGPQELLLTIGYCIPRSAAAQVKFIQRLAESGLAGIAIGDEPSAPLLTKAMLSAADAHNFPVLITGHATPYSVISRVVASANQHEQLHRLSRLSRLSTVLGHPAGTSERSMLSLIADELGHDVHVIDAKYGTEILAAPRPIDPRVGQAITKQVGLNTDRLPARVHVELGEQSATCFPVPSSRRAAMLVVPDSAGSRIDPFAVLHVANLIAIELERLAASYESRRQRASYLLRQLIDGRLNSESAAEQLMQFGLTGQPVVAAALTESDAVPANLLMDRDFPYVMTESRGVGLLLLPAAKTHELVETLSDSMAVGTSDVIHSLSHVGDAVREARWALETAQSQGGGHVDYASAHPLFLPRTVTEARNATRTVLGALLDYDEQHDTELVRSLEVYFACDRSWKQAAQVLRIHKQTLGYRLKQIEALAGRRLSSSGDIAELWLALLALRVVSDPLPVKSSETVRPSGAL